MEIHDLNHADAIHRAARRQGRDLTPDERDSLIRYYLVGLRRKPRKVRPRVSYPQPRLHHEV